MIQHWCTFNQMLWQRVPDSYILHQEKRNYCSSLDNIACSWIKPSACYYPLHVDEILGLKIVGTIGISTYIELASCSISMVCETMHASHEATVAQWFGCQPVLQKILVRFHACSI